MTVESVTALLEAGPFVIAIVAFGMGWVACQRYALKPAMEQIQQANERIAVLEAREADLMGAMQRKIGLS